MPCETNADECSLIDDFKLKPKDAPSDVPRAIHPEITQVSRTQSAVEIGWHPTRSPPPGKKTPLNVLYCVYLD